MRILKTLILPLALAFAPVAASAAAVIGGDTVVTFGSAIGGLSFGATGTATVIDVGPKTNFLITGGELDENLAGQIRHDGSGVNLSNGINSLDLGNFVIDTTTQTLFGDASLNGSLLGTSLALFTFDLASVTVAQLTDLANPSLALIITSTTAGALTTAFGAPDTTGATIGFAATAPQLAVGGIPEPATWALLIGGFGATGIAMRRMRRPAIAA